METDELLRQKEKERVFLKNLAQQDPVRAHVAAEYGLIAMLGCSASNHAAIMTTYESGRTYMSHDIFFQFLEFWNIKMTAWPIETNLGSAQS